MDLDQFQSCREVILGIDPGTQVTGYGLIEVVNKGYIAIDCGQIKPPSKYKLSDRYLIIFDSILKIIEKYQPKALAVETQYVNKNVQSTIKLGMARGVIVVAAKKLGVPVFEYTPTQAKKAVVGHGNASKNQVDGMVRLLLNLAPSFSSLDAMDALALAICHAHANKSILITTEF